MPGVVVLNVSVNEQLALAARTEPHVVVREKEPDTLEVPTVKGAFPSLCNVTVRVTGNEESA